MTESCLEDFLRPLHIDVAKAHALSRELGQTFEHLSAESQTQFLPTPISESVLRPAAGREKGRYLAIDIGGTNLRVGFIELLGEQHDATSALPETNGQTTTPATSSNLRRVYERTWPILEHLKNENADAFFAWIGNCIAEVVREGCETLGLARDREVPMGVAFSFPMKQRSLADATLMPMGKGFAITSKRDLGTQLAIGYEKSRTSDLPRIKVTAIVNDAVATLVSFIYQSREDATRKAAMGLICGTGSNATIPLRRSILHPDKLPEKVKVLADEPVDNVSMAVNTEWSINGSAPALHKFGLVSRWDTRLDAEGEKPGFQPLEYMTAGRYLGELGRLMLVEYARTHLSIPEHMMPAQLQKRFGLTTTFLSHFWPLDPPALLQKLEVEFPPSTTSQPTFKWTEECAVALYHIAKAIQVRAAGIVAAAIVGLLACAGDIPLREPLRDGTNRDGSSANGAKPKMHLIVGYTGGCIVHFQDYLADCQKFLDSIIEAEFGDEAPVRVLLSPCHDGGITGAGVLCGASQAQAKDASC